MSAASLLDLSAPFGPNPGERIPVGIERFSHGAGGAHLAELVGIDPHELPSAEAWASERITAITHSGTHMDAPYHYSRTCAGARARTIDELPLPWFYAPGCCIDVAAGSGDTLVSSYELAAWERRQGHSVGGGEIVLFHTGAGARFGRPGYSDVGRGLAPELVRALVSRGVRVIGTDAWSIDPPYAVMRARASARADEAIWGAHFVGRELEFCALEKLCGLEQLPPFGFTICCFPIQVQGGSAGWVRAVAILERRST